MTPEKDAAQVGILVNELVFLHHAVDPPRHGDSRFAHHGNGSIAALDPVEVDAPGFCKMLPRTLCKAVVTGKRIGVRANIGGTLHVVMATKDIGSASGYAHVAQRELQNARSAHDGVAGGVLGLAHAPYNGRWPVLRHHFGSHVHACFRNAACLLNLVRRPFGQHLGLYFFHAVNAVVDVFCVFPTVLEDVMQHAEKEGNIGPRAQPNEFIGLGCRAGKARIHHDHLAAGFLGMEHVQKADRMCLGSVRADIQRALAVLHVVV